jgi:hypothetical protein
MNGGSFRLHGVKGTNENNPAIDSTVTTRAPETTLRPCKRAAPAEEWQKEGAEHTRACCNKATLAKEWQEEGVRHTREGLTVDGMAGRRATREQADCDNYHRFPKA